MDEGFEVEGLMLDEEEIASDVWDALHDKGYVPTSDEVLDIAEIVFDLVCDIFIELAMTLQRNNNGLTFFEGDEG